MSSKRKTSLLIVAADRPKLIKHTPHLVHLGYHVEVTTDITGALKILEATGGKKPDVVMLSWNLRGEDVPARYKYIMETLKVPCLVFSEDQSRRANNSLLKSRIPNVVFPPLSAHGIDRRIQLLLRGSRPDVGPMTQLKHREAEDPTYVPDVQMDKADEAAAQAIEADLQKSRAVLEESIKESVRNLIPNIDLRSANGLPPDAPRLLMLQVSWGQLEGYLIIGFSHAKIDEEFLVDLDKTLRTQLEGKGEMVSRAENSFEVSMSFSEFQDWAHNHAQVLVSDGPTDGQVLVAFVDLESLPSISREVSDDFVWADLEGWLATDSQLLFDVYIHLPTNQKFVLYLRKNSNVSDDVLNRVAKHGSERCFLTPKDCGELFKYCIQAALQAKRKSA